MAETFEKIARDIEQIAHDLENVMERRASHDDHDHGHGVSQKEQREDAYKELKRTTDVEWDDDAHLIDDEKKMRDDKKPSGGKQDSYDHGHGRSGEEQNNDAHKEWMHAADGGDYEKIQKEEDKRYSAGGKMDQSTNAVYYGDKNPSLHKHAKVASAIDRLDRDSLAVLLKKALWFADQTEHEHLKDIVDETLEVGQAKMTPREAAIQQEVENIQKIAKYLEDRGE